MSEVYPNCGANSFTDTRTDDGEDDLDPGLEDKDLED
jgi:hypothetical protein